MLFRYGPDLFRVFLWPHVAHEVAGLRAAFDSPVNVGVQPDHEGVRLTIVFFVASLDQRPSYQRAGEQYCLSVVVLTLDVQSPLPFGGHYLDDPVHRLPPVAPVDSGAPTGPLAPGTVKRAGAKSAGAILSRIFHLPETIGAQPSFPTGEK